MPSHRQPLGFDVIVEVRRLQERAAEADAAIATHEQRRLEAQCAEETDQVTQACLAWAKAVNHGVLDLTHALIWRDDIARREQALRATLCTLAKAEGETSEARDRLTVAMGRHRQADAENHVIRRARARQREEAALSDLADRYARLSVRR